MIEISEKGISDTRAIARRSRGAMIFAVSLFIIAGVFWWLKLTGITLAGEAFCGIGEHTHTEECLEASLTCTEQDPEHSHTDECYVTVCSLGLSEHVHTAECYSDTAADVETAADWESTLEGITLTGNYSKDICAVARSQTGYAESSLNFKVDSDGVRRGYSRYGDWYGNPYGDWSGMFVSFCLSYSDIPSDIAPYGCGEETMRLHWESAGLFCKSREHAPIEGDIVFFDKDENGSADSVGIVTGLAGDVITVVEGNCNDTVAINSYGRESASVMGYGSLAGVIESSLSERDRARVENAKAHIEALPDEDSVLLEMEEYDTSSPEFEEWFYALKLKVTTAYVYYEDLGENLRLLVSDTDKLDSLSWIWQAQTFANTTISTVNVYQANKYSNALSTVVYGGSVESIMGSSLDYSWWTAVVIDKNDTGYYVSLVNSTGGVSKLSMAPSTDDGFILLVWHGSDDISALSGVVSGLSVQVNPQGFFTSKTASTTAIGTLTFMTEPAGSNSNEDINKDKLTIIEGADTYDLIKINLYNYSSNINELYENDHNYPGFQQDGGTKSLSSLSRFGMNFGNNITEDIATQIGDVTTNDPGTINKTVNTANSPVSGAMLSELADGYPAMADGTSLYYLFSDSTYATKQNTDNINGLFKYNSETGAYTFNSRENHAQFEADTNTFVLYDQIITSNFIMYPFGNFLPMNNILTQTTQTTTIDKAWFQETAANALMKYNLGEGDVYLTLNESLTKYVSLMDSAYGTGAWGYRDSIDKYFSLNSIEFTQTDEYLDRVYSIDYDEATNFFFGMDMYMEFIQPKGGLTGVDGKQPMVFDFTGDDDVWIYVDGKLFLDLTGIHRHVGGRIDFVNGLVYYYDLDVSTGDVTTTPTQTVTFAEILGSDEGLDENGTFEDHSEHTLNFYYMERGAGSGVCRMNFNLPLVRANHISVSKELTLDDTAALGNPDFKFQVLKADTRELFIGSGVEFEIYDAYGNLTETSFTDENGIFCLKAGETAVFADIPEDAGSYFVRELFDDGVFGQYDTVGVDGTSTTVDTYTDVLVGSEAFKGIDSSIKDISNGSTHFTFNNYADASKLGSVCIEKLAEEYSADAPASEFVFDISLDSEPVPAGTVYTLTEADGTERSATVESDGILKLSSGQKARFDNILAGSKLTVREQEESAEGYAVTYIGENIELSETEIGVCGTVEAAKLATVLVKNDKEGTKLTVPAEKTLLYSDGISHTYTFTLREIVSPSDTSPVEGGKYIKSAVTFTDIEREEFFFRLNYPPDETVTGTYYYLISEDDSGSYGADDTFYVVEVAVVNDGGTVTAEVICILEDATTPSETVSFENKIVRSLTVTKTVENKTTEERFAFNITAAAGGIPLAGTYSCSAPDGQTQIVFEEGRATVFLRNGEELTVYDLPYGTEWTVTEKDTEGYFTKVSVNGADATVTRTASGVLTESSKVAYTNVGGYELPATGGSAQFVYIFGGTSLVAFSLICGCVQRRKRERRYRD